MGLFDRIPGKKPPPEKKEPKQKRQRKSETFDSFMLKQAKKLAVEDPEGFRPVVEAYVGRKFGTPRRKSEIETLVENYEALQGLGMLGGGKKEDEWWKDLIKQVGPLALVQFMQTMQGGMRPQIPPSTFKPSPEPVESSPPPVIQQAPALPAPSHEPIQPTPATEDAAVSNSDAPTEDTSAALIARFIGQPPETLVQFLMSQQDEGIKQLVGILRKVNTAAARGILEQVAGSNPDLAPFIAWLLEPERAEWLNAALAALKASA